MKFSLIKKASILFAVCISANIYGNEENHEHRQHEAHVHGKAELSFLIDGDAVAIELKSPALNVLGFEHEPKTNEEKEIVEQTNKKLSDYNNIISIDGLNCQVIESEIESPYESEHEEEHHDHKHHDDHHHGDDEHDDYYLSYSLKCENTDKLKTIEVKLFDNFDGFETIEATWINQMDIGSAELSSEQKIINLN
ncbi:MAG: ZrgA family zinc uptake protein [Gammaproteobacteria bacterium]|jgi:hypothetical protein